MYFDESEHSDSKFYYPEETYKVQVCGFSSQILMKTPVSVDIMPII